jgi:hypothetical protein
MALRSDSYGSVNEVIALTRHLLDGEATFTADTRPTEPEVEKFIDRASGVLNVAYRGVGFDPAVITANSTAKLPADDWVTVRAAQFVELTQRGAGWSDDVNTRLGGIDNMLKDANEFVQQQRDGLIELGISISGRPAYQGLQFTAEDKHSERSDPSNTSLEQPNFRRHQWDND